ncbi:MAG: HAMP domain-containing sensor histidine kinase [Terriglobia bacterium]
MDVAYELTPLVATKLVVYTFGTLIHLFLIVLILGNRRLRRLDWLLFALMAALFLWYSGNLLALNISLYYGAAPALLSGFSRTISIVGFIAAVPLLVHLQAEYCAGFILNRLRLRLVAALFYLPVTISPWIVGRLLARLGVEPLVALGPPVRLLVLWAAAALFFAAGVNVYLYVHRRTVEPAFARFYAYLAALQALLALGWASAYLPRALPPVGGLGGYFSTGLMLAGILPSALVGYSIFRYNFLDLHVQRNVLYSVAVIFGFLLYLNLMRRLSGWLEAHDVLPTAVTEGVMIFILVVLVEPLKRLISRALHQQFVSEFEKVQKLAAEIEEHAKQTGDEDSLQALVEERVPTALGLEQVRLLRGPIPASAPVASVPPKAHRIPISRGGATVAILEVVPAGGGVSGDQLAALEVLANRLAAALELCRLIADKIKLERELAEKEKMAFLGEMAARIAHNVKNPLSGMKTIVQLMEEDQALPANTRRDCRMLVEEIDRLNRNILQVLRYTKPARDTDRPADLASVARKIAAISRMEAERRHITLDVNDSGPCLVEGGEEAASDIVSNLLVNALEASDDGSAIRIQFAHSPGLPEYVELAVEDQGRGIPPDKLDKIFQPFFTTRAGGTGLGLAIVKRRSDEIGGSVDCESPVQEGNATSAHPGTRFVVRFRIAQSAVAKEPG